ncbi:MAG: hypothetical protein MI867_16885 [Pseudomonadales bacterium]|nr:hypothetical protein [Pseudomonadales bacterium]
MSKTKTPKPFRYRNHVARNPLLRKGGVHEKTTGAKRSANKRKLKKEAMNWKSDSSLSSFLGSTAAQLCGYFFWLRHI